jgi:TonB family protein
MHSMRPQKLAPLGLDPAMLCQRHPRLVFAGLHGFADGGPYSGKPAYDDIIQGLSGSASFTLAIDAAGRVSGCTITRSTGHGVLDAATCELVAKRARFDAARDGTGKPVAGNFNGSITWNIPE